MGHAAGQFAHRLQLLGLQQLVFEFLAGGDVASGGDQEFDLAVGVEHRAVRDRVPAPSVLRQKAVFVGRRVGGAQGRGEVHETRFEIVGVHQGRKLSPRISSSVTPKASQNEGLTKSSRQSGVTFTTTSFWFSTISR